MSDRPPGSASSLEPEEDLQRFRLLKKGQMVLTESDHSMDHASKLGIDDEKAIAWIIATNQKFHFGLQGYVTSWGSL